MANHKSAKKRALQDSKRRARNKSYLSQVRTAVKKFQTALQSGEAPSTAGRSAFEQAQSLLAKAVSKRLIHPNNAARKTRRLAAALKQATVS